MRYDNGDRARFGLFVRGRVGPPVARDRDSPFLFFLAPLEWIVPANTSVAVWFFGMRRTFGPRSEMVPEPFIGWQPHEGRPGERRSQEHLGVGASRAGPLTERPLRAGDTLGPRVALDGHAQRPSRRLENGLADVVAIAAVVYQHVQITKGVRR